MTYSEVVQLLSSHMVPSDDQNLNSSQSIPILEKFSMMNSNQENNLLEIREEGEHPSTYQDMSQSESIRDVPESKVSQNNVF